MRRCRSPIPGNRYTRKEGKDLTLSMALHGVTVGDIAEASGEAPETIESAMECPKNSHERNFCAWMGATEVWINQGRVSDFLAGAKLWAAQA